MLSGLCGVGKSTLTQKLLTILGYGTVVLSSDALIEVVAKAKGLTYSDVFTGSIKDATKVVEKMRISAVSNRKDIILDQTCLTKNSRKGKLAQIPNEYIKICIFLTVDEQERQKRLLNRPGKIIPAHVDLAMRESIELPCTSEGFDAVLYTDDIVEIAKTIEDIKNV